MRTRLLKGLWAASLMAVLAVLSVPAEAAELSYKVPFSFTVNGATLPAGIYKLSSVQSTLFVQGLGHGAVASSIRLESRKETEAKLVFHKYGDSYVLRQVWMSPRTGREVPESGLERELREAARSGKVAIQFERVSIPAM